MPAAGAFGGGAPPDAQREADWNAAGTRAAAGPARSQAARGRRGRGRGAGCGRSRRADRQRHLAQRLAPRGDAVEAPFGAQGRHQGGELTMDRVDQGWSYEDLADPARGWLGTERGLDPVDQFATTHAGRRLALTWRRRSDRKIVRREGAVGLFNADVLDDPSLAAEPLVVCQTEADALALAAAGIVRVVGLNDDRATVPRAERADSFWSWLAPIRDLARQGVNPILAFHDSPTGWSLREAVAKQIGRAKCRWLNLHGAPSPEAMVLAGRIEELAQAVREADWISVRGVYGLDELPRVDERPALDPGLGDLGKHCRLRTGDLMVVTGIPGHGKTLFLNNLLAAMHRRHGWRSCFCSPEQHPWLDHRRALLRLHAQLPHDRLSEAQMAAGEAWMREAFCWMVAGLDDTPDIAWFLEMAETAAVRFGAKAIVLDPWNELVHRRAAHELGDEYANEALRRIRVLARELDVLVIIAAHPRKQDADPDTGDYPVPALYDVSGAAAWKNKPDLGVVVHRYPRATLLRVEKTRYEDVHGRPGDLEVHVDPQSGRYARVATLTTVS
ncbi:MAG: hypothetical protein EA356_12485 [Geminicoccaceae bacterium]|nr:MAG: hypothetical protein EA356_12485 [Geminicoccaceae bacterium]